jgi:hypothetical protein
LQYVLFPPYTATTTVSDVSCSSVSSSEEENDEVTTAEDSELKIMTEIWVEPQVNHDLMFNPVNKYFNIAIS